MVAPTTSEDEARDSQSTPSRLGKDPAFWGMMITQFLGAFNDNFFKQLILLLALKVAQRDMQPVAMALFASPFLLFSGFAGFLSDRYSKRVVIVSSKVAEIVVMALAVVAFLSFVRFGFSGLLVVLFLMGTQSAFFGPGKYGILPEMLRPSDLPRANGIILMTTFLAIIGGTATAGIATDMSIGPDAPLDESAASLYLAALVSVAIALLGTVTSLWIRRVPPANRELRFNAAGIAMAKETRLLLVGDRPLLGALLASCMFWLLAGVTQQAVNSLGKVQLQLTDFATSILAASIGLGIAIGALLAGRFSRGTADFRVMRLGAWGTVVSLVLLALPGQNNGHLWGYPGSLCPLLLLGISAGMFAIPLQVFLQARPPEGLKGRMIAVMNQANFLAIFLSAAVYFVFDQTVDALGWERSQMFGFAALLMLPVAVRGLKEE